MTSIADDPWSVDYPERIALAKSILGHADTDHWQQAIDRALLALQGTTIDEILNMENALAVPKSIVKTPISPNLPTSQRSLSGNGGF